jgi:23S rRNA (uracil1939-C5)-methyltransferase
LGYQIQECGLHLLFDPRQFTQVNAAMNLELISRTLCLLGELAGKRVIDLFCGIGNFSLPLGRRGAIVLGLEVDAGSVEMARLNAQRNGLHGMTFDIADLYDTPDTLPEADVLVLDPPRSGAGPNLERWLAQSKCGQLVYVSCNAQTFAADAARICAAGFCLLEAGAFDMFPHTAHVESMGYFERQGD